MRRVVALALAAVAAGGCAQAPDAALVAADQAGPAPTTAPPPASQPAPTPAPATGPEPAPSPSPPPAASPVPARPAWLGTRVLPLRDDGFGQVLPTPAELVDRRLPPPVSALPAPAGGAFAASVGTVPDDVVARSTWSPACPVGLAELRYVTVTFWGFDAAPHTGELLVHADAADDLVEVFRRLYDARFPIEEMRVVAPPELDAPPTGDGNNTTAFVCRPTRGSTSWSQHAYGLGLDVNPFHNPYVKDDLVLPELASAYTDRGDVRPGMVLASDVVTEAFASIGWGWGGSWSRPTDPMHFSASGR